MVETNNTHNTTPYKQAATYIIDKEDYVPYSPDRHGITAWVIFLTSAF
nr:7784_t:CDS:2 [Entrophospora candida]